MATWVRTGTGTAPSATDANLSGQVTLGNATAPGDFDPNGVTNVNIAWRLTIAGLSDDSWTDNREARLRTAAALEIATINFANTNRTANGNYDSSGNDATPNTARSTTEWEGATVDGAGAWAVYNKNKGGDGTTASIPVAQVVVTITYTPAAAQGATDQVGYRLRDDDGTETGATWQAANNTLVNQPVDVPFRIRFAVEETGGVDPVAAQVWSLWSNVDSAGWSPVTSSSLAVTTQASTHFANNDPTTDQAVGGAGTFEAGLMMEGVGAADGLAAGGHTEHEWCIQLDGSDLTGGETVELQVRHNGGVLTAYTQAGPTFTVPSPPSIDWEQWGFYEDGAEASAPLLGPLAAVHRNAVTPGDAPFVFRAGLKGTGTVLPKLQYAYLPNGGGGSTTWTPSNTTWIDVGSATSRLKVVASPTLTDNQATTARLGMAGTFVAGKVDEGDGTFDSGVTLSSEYTEFAWVLQIVTADQGTPTEPMRLRVVPSTSAADPSATTPYNTETQSPGTGLWPVVNAAWTFDHDFEDGTNGVAVTDANSGASPDEFDKIIDGGHMTYSNVSPAHGSLSLDIDKSDAVIDRIRWWDIDQGAGGFFRCYIYPITNDKAQNGFFLAQSGFEGSDSTVFQINLTPTWQLVLRDQDGVLETTVATLTANEWNRIEVRARPESGDAAGDGVLEVRVWTGDANMDSTGTADITIGPYTAATTDTEWEDFEFGFREGVTTTAHVRIDDVALSNGNDWIGPVVSGISGTGVATSNSSEVATGTKAGSGVGAATSNSSVTRVTAPQKSGTGAATSDSSSVGSGVAAEPHSGTGATTSNSSATALGSKQASGTGTATSNSSAVGSGVAVEAASGSGTATSNSSTVASGAGARSPPAGITATSNSSEIATGAKAASGTGTTTSNSSSVGSGSPSTNASGSGSATSNSSETATGTKAASGTGSTTSNSSTVPLGAPNVDGGANSATSNSSEVAAGTRTASGVGAETSNTQEIATGTKATSGTGTTTSNSSAVGTGVAAEGSTGSGAATSNSSGAASGTKAVSGTGATTSNSSTVPLGLPNVDGGAVAATSNSSVTHVTTSQRSGSGSATSNSSAVGTGVPAEGATGTGAATSNSSEVASGNKDTSGVGTASSNSSAVGSGVPSLGVTGTGSATSNSSATASGVKAAAGAGVATSNSSVIRVTTSTRSGLASSTSNSSAVGTGVPALGVTGTGTATSNSSETSAGTSARSGSGAATSNSSGTVTGIPGSGDPGNETSGSGANGAGQKNGFGAGAATSNSSAAATGVAAEQLSGTGTATSNSSASGTGTSSIASSVTALSESSHTAVGSKSTSGTGSATSESSYASASASAARPYTMTTDPVPQSVVTILNNRSVVSIRRTP